jgi:sugar O-acyltransferase (sialic acid O-acetyltransferase NeuD family)
MINLIIIGAGGQGTVIAEIAALNNFNVLFWDDDPIKYDKDLNIEKRKISVPNRYKIIIAIGDNLTRKNISVQYTQELFATLIHPQSIISKNVQINIGTVIMGGVCINNNANIGKHCIINTLSVIEHDVIIKDYVHVSPNATLLGNSLIGYNSWIGAGAIVLPGVEIGENCIVGAGTVVLKDVPPNSKVVGNPGRLINE